MITKNPNLDKTINKNETKTRQKSEAIEICIHRKRNDAITQSKHLNTNHAISPI